MTDILKQDQYAPLPVEKQVLILFAGSNGYLDGIEVEECLEFEAEMYKFFDAHHQDLLQAISGPDGISDELKAALSKALDECSAQFQATRTVAAS